MVSNNNSGGLPMENDGGVHQMKKDSCGLRTKNDSVELQMEPKTRNDNDWVNNSGGL